MVDHAGAIAKTFFATIPNKLLYAVTGPYRRRTHRGSGGLSPHRRWG